MAWERPPEQPNEPPTSAGSLIGTYVLMFLAASVLAWVNWLVLRLPFPAAPTWILVAISYVLAIAEAFFGILRWALKAADKQESQSSSAHQE